MLVAELEEEVLDIITRDPTTSIRRISASLSIPTYPYGEVRILPVNNTAF